MWKVDAELFRASKKCPHLYDTFLKEIKGSSEKLQHITITYYKCWRGCGEKDFHTLLVGM